RTRLSWGDMSTLLPYLVIAALWACYILIRPDYFLAQFGANASARGGARWTGLSHPLSALAQEIVTRYVAHFGFLPLWGGPVPKYAIGIPIAYWLTLVPVCLLSSIRRWANVRAVLCLAGIFLAFMTFFIVLKAQCYMVLIIPLYAALLAIWLCRSHSRGSATAPLSAIVTTGLLVCQIGTIAFKIRKNAYASEY